MIFIRRRRSANNTNSFSNALVRRDGDYNIEVDAPLGYVFAENSIASFTYESTSTPGRLMFSLTLQKI